MGPYKLKWFKDPLKLDDVIDWANDNKKTIVQIIERHIYKVLIYTDFNPHKR